VDGRTAATHIIDELRTSLVTRLVDHARMRIHIGFALALRERRGDRSRSLTPTRVTVADLPYELALPVSSPNHDELAHERTLFVHRRTGNERNERHIGRDRNEPLQPSSADNAGMEDTDGEFGGS
jgi:hypothetical protein